MYVGDMPRCDKMCVLMRVLLNEMFGGRACACVRMRRYVLCTLSEDEIVRRSHTATLTISVCICAWGTLSFETLKKETPDRIELLSPNPSVNSMI